jgi:hypothetical protein
LQTLYIDPRGFPDGGAVMEQPQPRRIQVDPEFARFTAPTRGAVLENVLQQRVQKLMHTSVDREERYLVAMRLV